MAPGGETPVPTGPSTHAPKQKRPRLHPPPRGLNDVLRWPHGTWIRKASPAESPVHSCGPHVSLRSGAGPQGSSSSIDFRTGLDISEPGSSPADVTSTPGVRGGSYMRQFRQRAPADGWLPHRRVKAKRTQNPKCHFSFQSQTRGAVGRRRGDFAGHRAPPPSGRPSARSVPDVADLGNLGSL